MMGFGSASGGNTDRRWLLFLRDASGVGPGGRTVTAQVSNCHPTGSGCRCVLMECGAGGRERPEEPRPRGPLRWLAQNRHFYGLPDRPPASFAYISITYRVPTSSRRPSAPQHPRSGHGEMRDRSIVAPRGAAAHAFVPICPPPSPPYAPPLCLQPRTRLTAGSSDPSCTFKIANAVRPPARLSSLSRSNWPHSRSLCPHTTSAGAHVASTSTRMR